MKLIFFPDVHNNFWFDKIIKSINKIEDSKVISLGDIAAVNTKEFLKNKEKYSTVWRYKRGNDIKISNEEIQWFDELNINGWNNQVDILKRNRKNLTLCMGNSDYAMLDWYRGKIKIPNTLKIIKKIKVCKFQKVFLIFLPYNSGLIKESEIKDLEKSALVYVVSHCPPIKESRKEYYKQIYFNIVKLCSLVKKVILIHGHMHPDNSYHYKIKELKNLLVLAPKSNDSEEGIGSYNNFVVLDTKSGEIKIFDLNLKEVESKLLPRRYYMIDRHWNKFNP